jgi:hypothetical protein
VRTAVAAAVLALVAAIAAAPARADGERPLPWEGGATVETEAERLFGQVASEIVGRPVQVRCNGETDWAILLAQRGISGAGGYANIRGGFTELSPSVCWFLDRYATTTPKPAYWCTATTTVTEWVQKQKRVRVRKPLLKSGKPVLRKGKPVLVWTTRIVTTKVPQQRERIESVKCEGAVEWWNYPYALLALAHESYHLRGVLNEAATQCYGIQAVARTAERLGATDSEAKIASDYAWATTYPGFAATYPEYGSPDCRPDGALDLTPGDGRWP